MNQSSLITTGATFVLSIFMAGCGSGLNSADPTTRHNAIEKLTDQKQLTKVGLEDPDAYLRSVALGKVTDQAALTQAILDSSTRIIQGNSNTAEMTGASGKTRDACEEAMKKVTDQSHLTRIAFECQDEYLGSSAVCAITNQAELSKVAVEHRDHRFRFLAIGKLTDEAVLSRIALQDPEARNRISAVARITDKSLLPKLALESNDPNVRQYAEQNVAYGIELDPTVRMWIDPKVTRQVTDQPTLSRIALESKSPEVRLVAIRQLTDQIALAAVVQQEKDTTLKRTAICQLDDRVLLSKLANAGDEVALVRRLLVDPLVISVLGNTRLEYNFRPVTGPRYATKKAIRDSLQYGAPGSSSHKPGYVIGGGNGQGECLSMTVSGPGVPRKKFRVEWTSTFPGTIPEGGSMFFPAPFAPFEVINKVLELLPPATLNQIAANDENLRIRQAAARIRH